MLTNSTLTAFEKIDLSLRISTFLTIVAGGLWGIYQFNLTGSNDWTNNITLEAKVLPYHDNLRLLVVHVKSKNPRKYEYTLSSAQGDTFELRFQKIKMDVKENTVLAESQGDLIQKVDLMKDAGGEYQFLPGAEMDDMNMIVLPVNTTVGLTAEMNIHNGKTDGQGKPDTDFISASTVIRIE